MIRPGIETQCNEGVSVFTKTEVNYKENDSFHKNSRLGRSTASKIRTHDRMQL